MYDLGVKFVAQTILNEVFLLQMQFVGKGLILGSGEKLTFEYDSRQFDVQFNLVRQLKAKSWKIVSL